MNFSALATDVKVNNEFLTVSLEDGRKGLLRTN